MNSHLQMQKKIPENIEVIWKNSEDVVTLSGDPDHLKKLTVELENGGTEILGKDSRSEVTVHSKRIREIGEYEDWFLSIL